MTHTSCTCGHASIPDPVCRGPRGRSKAATLAGFAVAGITAGLALTSTLTARAQPANTAGLVSDLSVCTGTAGVPAPADPIYVRKFTAGRGTVNGTVPAPTPALLASKGLATVTPTRLNVVVTTSYDTARSGTGKTDVATVTLPGHSYTNPLLFAIPPVSTSISLGQGPVPYSAHTTGKAVASVVVQEFVTEATTAVQRVVPGLTCPAGLVKTGIVQTGVETRPGKAVNVHVAPGGDTSGGDPALHAAITVYWTQPPADASANILFYEILATDLDDPASIGRDLEPAFFAYSRQGSGLTYATPLSQLKPGHHYSVQVLGFTSFGTGSLIAQSTNTAVAQTGPTQNQSAADAKALRLSADLHKPAR